MRIREKLSSKLSIQAVFFRSMWCRLLCTCGTTRGPRRARFGSLGWRYPRLCIKKSLWTAGALACAAVWFLVTESFEEK